jgi:hypothetical protein
VPQSLPPSELTEKEPQTLPVAQAGNVGGGSGENAATDASESPLKSRESEHEREEEGEMKEDENVGENEDEKEDEKQDEKEDEKEGEEEVQKPLATVCANLSCAHVGDRRYKPKRCPCKLVRYCSRECQLATWEEHKSEHEMACGK